MNPASLTERFARAMERARALHGSQKRRGADIPYMAHVLGVAALVLNDGGTEDQAIAALLHDTVEDHPDKISFQDIEVEFGPAVRQMVYACTEPGPFEGTWVQQKQHYIDHIRRAPPEAQRIILADKLDNARFVQDALARWGQGYWSRFTSPTPQDILWYHHTLMQSLSSWNGGPLYEEFVHLVQSLEPLLRKK